jgi:hypothetical protein
MLRSRARLLGLQRSVILIALALALAPLAGCASGSGGGATSLAEVTATPGGANITATVGSDATPTPGPFVCANPAGSNARYAYIAADHQLALVQGCSPKEIAARPNRALAPQAFSPSGRWLLASESSTLDPFSGTTEPLCETLIDSDTGATTLTPLCAMSPANAAIGWYGFIGWSDDATFYEAGWGAGANSGISVVRVTLPGMTVAKIADFPWVGNLANRRTGSGIVLRNGALYYAGYASASDHSHAWLRRYTIATGQNTRIVSLGIAGYGGCQVQVDNSPCAWAGPWDISPDGSRIAYHIPGPTQSITDTSIEQGTPLYLAASDGSGATRLFPDEKLGAGFSSPVFSVDGRYMAQNFQRPATIERLSDGVELKAPDGYVMTQWTATSQVAVLQDLTVTADYLSHPVLYNAETKALTPLQAGSYQYIWA